MKPTKQYLVRIQSPGRATVEQYYSASPSLVDDDTTPADTACYAASAAHPGARCTAVRDHLGKLVTRTAP